MASLEIRKKANKVFQHISNGVTFIGSDFEISSINNTIKVVKLSGAPVISKDGFLISEITVYDDTAGGIAEPFGTIEELFERLVDLGYNAFYEEGQLVSIGLEKPKEISFTNFGGVPTAGSVTLTEEVADFINDKTFTFTNDEFVLLKFAVTTTINGIEYLVYRSYFFAKNNIGGDWGTGTINGEVSASDLIFNYQFNISPSPSANTITIELGDILTDDIVTYLNNNPMPTVGQDWSLLVANDYFFTYISNGVSITDFYKGPKPVELGNQVGANYVVTTADFQRISTDGQIDDIYEPSITVTANTGTAISLANVIGNLCNMASPNAATTYTTVSEVDGGSATVLINAASEPTITGATKIKGSDFLISTNMELYVRYNGVVVQYFFLEL